MYYEEKIINGVLMCRRNPKGDWEQCSITKMSSDIIELKQQLADLKADNEELKAKWEQVLCENLDLSAGIAAFRASQNKVRADAVIAFCDWLIKSIRWDLRVHGKEYADKLEADNE